MNAQGYQSAPLSDEMERRIRERLKVERAEMLINRGMGRDTMAAIGDGKIAAFEWVLREAESLTLSHSPFYSTCPDCGHEHLDEKKCNFPYAKDRECACERKVSA